jgi:hypothetical protein
MRELLAAQTTDQLWSIHKNSVSIFLLITMISFDGTKLVACLLLGKVSCLVNVNNSVINS